MHRYSGIVNILPKKQEGLLEWTRLVLELPFKRVMKGKIEVTGRRGRRHKQLLEDLKEK